MKKFYLVLGAAAALVIGSAAACSSETGDGTGGGGGGTSTGTSTGTASGTSAGTSTGTGTPSGSTECGSCSDWAVGLVETEGLCGYLGNDPDTGALECDAASSCELLADIQACTCTGSSLDGTGCLDLCEDNGCAGLERTSECETCVYVACVDEVNGCIGDV